MVAVTVHHTHNVKNIHHIRWHYRTGAIMGHGLSMVYGPIIRTRAGLNIAIVESSTNMNHVQFQTYTTSAYVLAPKWIPVSGALETEMMKYWNWCAKSESSQESDWEHEWMRHGTCTQYYNSSITQDDYFNTVLDIYQSKSRDGSVENKCGNATADGSCYELCLDLNFNVIECPKNKPDI